MIGLKQKQTDAEIDSHGCSILVVDDVKEIQTYLKTLLAKLGYNNVDCVSCGNEAFTILSEKPFDVMFLDIELPDVDGKDILDQISFQYPDTKVIMCSGHNTLENVKQTWEMGAKGFVSKPFDAQKVASIIKRIESL